MSIELKTFDGSEVASVDDARLFEKIFPQNGIITGCVMTHLGGNQVSITAGTGILQGRAYMVALETLLVQLSSSGSKPGRIYIHCDLSDSVTPIQILSVCETTLPTLVQESDFNESNGIWEEELATYTGTTTAITDLTVTYKNISELLQKNSVLNTLEDVLAETDDFVPCGTKAVKELSPTPKTITWASGNTPITSLCYKMGNMVHISFNMPFSTEIVNGIEVVGTVPLDCRPSVPTNYIALGHANRIGSGSTYADNFGILARVDTNGNIHLANDFGINMFGAKVSFEYFVD